MERKGFWMNFRTKAGVCRLWRNCWRRSMKPTQWTENLAVAKKDHCSAVPGDTRLYIPAAVAAQQFRLKSSWLSSLECRPTGGARLSLPYSWRRSPWGRVWLRSGNTLTTWSSTGPSNSGVHVDGRVSVNREDILNTNCSWTSLPYM